MMMECGVLLTNTVTLSSKYPLRVQCLPGPDSYLAVATVLLVTVDKDQGHTCVVLSKPALSGGKQIPPSVKVCLSVSLTIAS